MLKQMKNEARFTLRITTTGPILIRSGQKSVGGGPDINPVRTFRNGVEEVYLPGSSLKGVFRSYIEKINATLNPDSVCNIFLDANKLHQGNNQSQVNAGAHPSCGSIFEKWEKDKNKGIRSLEDRNDFVYGISCPTCRLFGSTWFIGRVSIGDAYLAQGSQGVTETRDVVGIDRLTGGAANQAKFDYEAVAPDTIFETNIHLRNFEIWQLGMLFAIVQDMKEELIRLGSGTSRGLGQVRAEIEPERGLIISSIRNDREPANEIWGLGRWLQDQGYGTKPGDQLTLAEGVEFENSGVRRIRHFTGDALTILQNQAITYYADEMIGWQNMPNHLKNITAAIKDFDDARKVRS